MENQDAAIEQTIKAIEDAGMFVFDLGGGILNVHNEPIRREGDDATYLYTLTVSVTP